MLFPAWNSVIGRGTIATPAESECGAVVALGAEGGGSGWVGDWILG